MAKFSVIFWNVLLIFFYETVSSSYQYAIPKSNNTVFFHVKYGTFSVSFVMQIIAVATKLNLTYDLIIWNLNT